ncbi:DUF2480 family protein [Robiginitalea aurantiaca]|uniref:DUF2480 family protein n=1 Tax=Robiginitalea aurantiaca TaxID=3056915 RepID=A0ABT7WAR2_9FLAO|nr:DUF2480 family protein [Robiginitalea aurantiaca]MDM9629999.1 DUF2480 family protein [Robiginitalea aurantiaca]
MEKEIVNRVAKSKLTTLDLETFYPRGPRFEIDLSQWLDEGLILRETPFRNALKEHQWESYKDGYVAVHCSTDAIVPVWAYMLAGNYLKGIARETVVGSLEVLETILFREALSTIDLESLKDRPVIIKGCSNVPVPASAYVWAIQRIQEVAKSVMFGEACSSVPLFKRT